MVTATELSEAEHLLQQNLPRGAEVAMAAMPADEVSSFIIDGIDPIVELRPAEAEFISNAVERRRLEFALGRHLARRAMVALGGEPSAVPVGRSRGPIWPTGFVGSISHTRGLVAVAVAPAEVAKSIGIDIERARSVTDDLAPQILTPPELERHFERPELDLATIIFSAKETVYKTTFPVAEQWLGFEDATVVVNDKTGEFHAAIAAEADHSMAGSTLTGCVFKSFDHVITSSSL